MKSDSVRYLELVERRVALLSLLVRAEGDWRRAFIGLDMQNAERCVANEEQICASIRALDTVISSLQVDQSKRTGLVTKTTEFGWSKTPDTDPNIHRNICAALERMAGLHLELKRSSLTRQAILRRSRQTVNALRNLFNSYAPTYAAPASPGVGTIYEERV